MKKLVAFIALFFSIHCWSQTSSDLYNLGHKAWRNKEYTKAINLLTSAIKKDSSNDKAYGMRGLSKSDLKDYEAAIADFNIAIRLKPMKAVFYNMRGLSRFLQDNYSSAIKDFDKAISLSPEDNYYQAYCDRGVSNFMLGYYDKAREARLKEKGFTNIFHQKSYNWQ